MRTEAIACDNPKCNHITTKVTDWIRIQCRPAAGKGAAENYHVVIRMPGKHAEHRVSPPGGFAFCSVTCAADFMLSLCGREHLTVPRKSIEGVDDARLPGEVNGS